MSGDTEVLFAVQVQQSSTQWTMQLVNPDGSICTEKTFDCGPFGFTISREDEIAEWVGVQAENFINTMFEAAWEQANTNQINTP